MTTLGAFSIEDIELAQRSPASSLEVNSPSLRDARENTDNAALGKAKQDLVQCVAANLSNATFVGRERSGRRYAVFSVLNEAIFGKVLQSDGRHRMFPMTDDELRNLMVTHGKEHAAAVHYFGDAVPDTLFYQDGGRIKDDHSRIHQALRTRPFQLQEGVIDGLTVEKAITTARAESDNFRRSLEERLVAFQRMGDDLSLVPDIPGFNQPNLLVDRDGNVRLIDTNTLVKPDEYQTFHIEAYRFDFEARAQELLRSLEQGHVPTNPQG